MKERIIGLYKSILMRLQLMLSPMITWGLNAISIINALTSIVVIAILIYALGFPISFDQAIPLPLFLFSFYFFFSEYTFNFIKRIKSHIKSSSTKYKIKKRINPIFVILYGIIISFSIIYAPRSMLIGWLVPAYSQGFLRFFMTSFGSVIVMILLMLLMAGISALFNGFAGLITAYVYELISGIKKETNENNTKDFTIE